MGSERIAYEYPERSGDNVVLVDDDVELRVEHVRFEQWIVVGECVLIADELECGQRRTVGRRQEPSTECSSCARRVSPALSILSVDVLGSSRRNSTWSGTM